MMRILFPSSPFNPKVSDDLVKEQYESFLRAGYGVSLFSLESLQSGRLILQLPPTEPGDFLYRGWMLTESEYRLLSEKIASLGSSLWTNPEQYLAAHHLPKWYPLIKDLTAETVILEQEEATEAILSSLSWDGYFVKDFVKSLKTSCGSRITNPRQLPALLREMKHFRGHIEGGICLRKFEHLEANSEIRYFVIKGVPFAPTASEVPHIVTQVAARIKSPFFSVDVARRHDGVLRVVEIGDGQVSDLVGWTADRFAAIWSRFSR